MPNLLKVKSDSLKQKLIINLLLSADPRGNHGKEQNKQFTPQPPSGQL